MSSQDKDVKQGTVPGVCGKVSSVPLLLSVLLKTSFVMQILFNIAISNMAD